MFFLRARHTYPQFHGYSEVRLPSRYDARCRPFPQVRAASGNDADQGTARSRGAEDEPSDAEEGAAGSSGSSEVGGASDSDFQLDSDDGRPKSRCRPARRPSPPRSARARPPARPTRSSAAARRTAAPPARRSGRSAGRPPAGRYAESDESGSD
jgi:hypothetical protein